MTNEQKQFLVNLVNTPAPSGFEEPVQQIWRDEVSTFCQDIKKDIHGNLTATLNPGKERSIMIVGHSDEIGLIINYINEDGFIYVKPIGGVDPTILASHRARILSKKGIVDAVIGRTSLHLLTNAQRDKKLEMHDIWLDIGAKNRKDAEKYISIGDPVVFGGDFCEMTNGNATSRCWDNRIGVYIVAETLRKLSKAKNLKHTVYGVSSVQEETGVFGAGNPAFSFKPNAAIAIDVMPSSDQPEIPKERFGVTKLGLGPVITRGVRSNNKLTNELINTAKRTKIKHQIEVDFGHTWTDADPISQSRGGVAIGVVSVATRYLHSSVETLNLKDIDLTVDLLAEFISKSKLEF
ncbi:MAG: M42 family peptidase [Ignavibacteria bacterium]|nr:M42 family peptidase [Ignavibacteria bacterium]